MKIHERYIARELLAAILLVLGALIALYGFFDLIESLKDVGRGDFSARHALLYVTLRLPGRIYELMPIAVLIGALYALSALSRHSEITVLRASGMSTGALLLQLFRVAGLFAIALLLLGETAVPVAERKAQELRARAIHRVVAQEFDSGLWMKDDRAFLHIRAATADAQRLERLRIYQFNAQGHLDFVLEARSGIYQPATSLWQLQEVVQTIIREKDGKPYAQVETETERLWASALTPEIISTLMVAPERMSLVHLVTYLRHLGKNRQKTDRYEIALWKKLFYPLAALVMVALALPFAFLQQRMGGMSLQIFCGVMIGVLFHMLNGLFSSLGVIRAWPPLASAAAPSLLFLTAAFAILWRVERR
ncbi:MAG: LPS export ABC transporter permease LptG [Zoogloeaceae bacterium]|jgi:lipopolysaccharide export system permease protein|nr:LPS export ABC transporter permease LptG [Zoogloeaceae bacterium]